MCFYQDIKLEHGVYLKTLYCKQTKVGASLLGAVINAVLSYLTGDKHFCFQRMSFVALWRWPQIWVQEVMSAYVPVRDKSDIPTKPFPKVNKQSLPAERSLYPNMRRSVTRPAASLK